MPPEPLKLFAARETREGWPLLSVETEANGVGKEYDVESCCVVRNTKNSGIDPASPYCIEGGGKNYVLMYSNKNSHNWKKPLQLEERDSDARDVSGVKTPLFLAIRAKHLPAIRLLIGTQLYLFCQNITRLNIFSHILYLQTEFRIWIRIGSGDNQVSGSISGSEFGSRIRIGIRMRIQEGKNDPQKKKKLKIFVF
jgi:hypothetical protein